MAKQTPRETTKTNMLNIIGKRSVTASEVEEELGQSGNRLSYMTVRAYLDEMSKSGTLTRQKQGITTFYSIPDQNGR